MNISNLFKKIFLATSAIFLTANTTLAQTNPEQNMANKKILVAYYSWSGNTKEVAEAIHEKVGGDIYRIETEQTYISNLAF